MNKKTRLIILIVCVGLFFIVAPVLVAYSMGYRFDFEKKEIVATGGIYVRTFPAAEEISIDSKISRKPGMFANSIFVQSLLPKSHSIFIKKTGYYDYSKNLIVEENQVTKLENVLLFKKNIGFEAMADEKQSPFSKIDKFLIKNNNLYYSIAPENSGLSAAQKSTPVLKSLIAFILQNNNIIWLGTDGFIYKSDLTNLLAEPLKLTLLPLKINKKSSYKIITDGRYIFVNDNGNLLFLNPKTNNLDEFYSPVKNAKISPDGKNIIYFNDKEIYISLLSEKLNKKILLYNSSEKINDCLWLNSDYIIIALTNKIIISEIDYRGNVNSIILPQTIILLDKKIDIKNPEISFNRQSGQLYVLTNDALLLSEKIVP